MYCLLFVVYNKYILALYYYNTIIRKTLPRNAITIITEATCRNKTNFNENNDIILNLDKTYKTNKQMYYQSCIITDSPSRDA